MFPFLVLSSTVVLLTVFGAGIFTGTLYVVAGALCVGSLITSHLPNYRQKYILPSLPLCFIIIVWLLLSAFPLPEKLEELTGDIRKKQNEWVRIELSNANSLGIINKFEPCFSLSRNRCGTLRMVIFLIAVFNVIGISSCLPKVWKFRYLNFLIFWVSGIAVLGFVGQHLELQGSTIWWSFTVPYSNPVACFANRNLFAGFVVLLCPPALLLCAYYFARRQFMLGLVNLAGFIVMTIAIVGAMSRGALVSYCLSIIVSIILVVLTRHRTRGLIVCLVACSAFLIIGLTVGGQFEQRVRGLKHASSDHSVQERITIWKNSFELWKDYPLIGVGANAFRSVFPHYKSIKAPRSFNYAVNSYLQLLVEGGLFGFVLFNALIVSYVINVWTHFRFLSLKREILIGVVGAIVAAMAHAAIDLAPYVLLYAIALSSLAGLALHSFQHSAKKDKMANGTRSIRVNTTMARSPRVMREKILWAFNLFNMIVIACIYLKYQQGVDQLDRSSYIISASPKTLATGLANAPTSWQSWYHLGRYGLFLRDNDSNKLGERCMSHAAYYNPNDFRLWEQLARVRKQLNNEDGAAIAYERMISVMPHSERIARERATLEK